MDKQNHNSLSDGCSKHILCLIFLQEKFERSNWKFYRDTTIVREEKNLKGKDKISNLVHLQCYVCVCTSLYVCGYSVSARKLIISKSLKHIFYKSKPLLFNVFFPWDINCFKKGVKSVNEQSPFVIYLKYHLDRKLANLVHGLESETL